jgi:mRNA-degrading endonuclease toxin of MazEF toxin-antitoxin module
MISERFDVVVVAFPFVDAPERKPRPALVLSTSVFNDDNHQTLLAMITRAAHTRWPSDHAIRDLGSAGLRHASVVRWKLFTLDNRIIARRIGRLEREDRKACAGCLAAILGLARSQARLPA